ncbi:hypothetical protein FGB62_330g06 [Gracilaria domingensis]|nr:hypothetical protein FGB62_330g06 [Gracilaria domingensis]
MRSGAHGGIESQEPHMPQRRDGDEADGLGGADIDTERLGAREGGKTTSGSYGALYIESIDSRALGE